jgi:hypothetical protein
MARGRPKGSKNRPKVVAKPIIKHDKVANIPKLWGLCPEGRYWYIAEYKDEVIAVHANNEDHAWELTGKWRWPVGVRVEIRAAGIEDINRYGLALLNGEVEHAWT